MRRIFGKSIVEEFCNRIAELNQGVSWEADHGSTGNVGQDKDQLEDIDKDKKKKKNSPAYRGES